MLTKAAPSATQSFPTPKFVDANSHLSNISVRTITAPSYLPRFIIMTTVNSASVEQPPSKRQKRPRAIQACELCRLKKTRCDETHPCSYCVGMFHLGHVNVDKLLIMTAPRYSKVRRMCLQEAKPCAKSVSSCPVGCLP